MQENPGQTRTEFESDLIIKAWQDDKFKQDLIANPQAAFEQKLGKKVPEDVEITVLEETPKHLYLVLPIKPQIEETEELSEEALDAVAGGRFGLISVGTKGGDVYFIATW